MGGRLLLLSLFMNDDDGHAKVGLSLSLFDLSVYIHLHEALKIAYKIVSERERGRESWRDGDTAYRRAGTFNWYRSDQFPGSDDFPRGSI